MNGDIDKIFGADESNIKDSSEAKVGGIPTTLPMSHLASYVLQTFRTNYEARRASGVESRLMNDLKAQTCKYTSEQEEKMRKAHIDPRVYSPVTSTKIRAAKAMLRDIFNSAGDRPWTVTPTPDPELPESIMKQVQEEITVQVVETFSALQKMNIYRLTDPQVQLLQNMIIRKVSDKYDEISNLKNKLATKRAMRMEKKIHDIMVEGGWIDAFSRYVDYICVFGTGVIIGPSVKNVATNEASSTELGTRTIKRVYKKIPTYEAVSPLDCFPAPDAREVDDGALCIRVRYTSNELWRYTQKASFKVGVDDGLADGWIPSTVYGLLYRNPQGGIKIRMYEDLTERREHENKTADTYNDCTNEGIRCFASVMGDMLIEEGIRKTPEGKKIKEDEYYNIDVIVMDGFVVYCRILDERMGRPVSKGVFYELPDSWWGESIADKLFMCQNTMNNVIKDLLQNMAAASGPQFWTQDLNRYIDRDGSAFKVYPFKMWTFQQPMMGASGPPMGVIQVPSNASELIGVFEKMRQQSDEDSGIPAYTYGQTGGQSGALRTAGGLQIFTEAASRGMKMVISTTDRLVTRDQVRKTFIWVMLNDDDMDIKGDIEIVPHGIMGKIMKAQQDQQRLQLLNLVLNSQFLQQLVGPKGIAVLLRPSILDVAINPDDVLPDDSKLEQMEILEKIKALGEAMLAQSQQQTAQQQEGQPPAGGGMPTESQPPGVNRVEPIAPKGGVEERRSVA